MLIKAIKNIFQCNKTKKLAREITNTDQLLVADMLQFAFLDNQHLSNKVFEVIGRGFYHFQYETNTSLEIKDSSERIFSISTVKNKIYVSNRLSTNAVRDIFPAEDFAQIFGPGYGESIKVREDYQGDLKEWLASEYRKIDDCLECYYSKNEDLLSDDNRESFDYYRLGDINELFFIDIEVYKDGSTDVYATITLTNRDIENMYAKS